MRTPIRRRSWGDCELTLHAPDEPGTRHDTSCICAECLFKIYEDSKKGPGRKWSSNVFRIGWLMHFEKIRILKSRDRLEELPGGGFSIVGPTEELNRYPGGIRLLIYRVRDYERAPAWRAVKRRLEEERGDGYADEHLPTYSQRIKSAAFRKVLGDIMEKKLAMLRAEAERLDSGSLGIERSEGLSLATRIRDFIFSRPGKKATRREIQRKFNVSGAEVDAAVDWLGGFHIYQRQIAHKLQRKRGGYRNKTTIVYAVKQSGPPSDP